MYSFAVLNNGTTISKLCKVFYQEAVQSKNSHSWIPKNWPRNYTSAMIKLWKKKHPYIKPDAHEISFFGNMDMN